MQGQSQKASLQDQSQKACAHVSTHLRFIIGAWWFVIQNMFANVDAQFFRISVKVHHKMSTIPDACATAAVTCSSDPHVIFSLHAIACSFLPPVLSISNQVLRHDGACIKLCDLLPGASAETLPGPVLVPLGHASAPCGKRATFFGDAGCAVRG